ncbi:MAG: glycosyltransferase family 4 protein [Methanoregula sp.]|nr:glycosyltransferase family 4 protein [Methanoregula sp.]
MAVKKILICGDYQTPDEPFYGGVSRSVYSTVQEVKRLRTDYEFHVCTLSRSAKKSFVHEEDNLVVHTIAFPIKNIPLLVPQQLTTFLIQRTIRRVRPDVVHAHGTGKDYAAPVIQWNPQKSVITVHGVTREESKHWTGIKGTYHRVTGRRVENFVLSKARTLIAVSPYVKRMILGQTRADITVIFNPVEKNFFGVRKKECPARLLFVGGIEERKGLDVLIKALALVKPIIPDVELHIVGGIRKVVYYHTLVSLIRSLGLDSSVQFMGSLAEQDLMREYAEAEIFVLPSYEESQGIVILEAMATGTPVIATRAGGIPDMIQDDVNGLLVDCGNDPQMAQCIISLLTEHGRRQRIARTGNEIASTYLPGPIARQHLDVYERLLS